MEIDMKHLLSRFLRDDSGATAIEYGLIAALISVVIIAVLTTLGDELSNTFSRIQTELQTANST